MTSRDFCYWLQGYFEVAEEGREPIDTGNGSTFTDEVKLSPKQVRMVRAHLALVFQHEIDPSLDGGDPEVKATRARIHRGTDSRPELIAC